jgi:glycosyltransferase involved in cell wall biosynthesis
MATVAPKNPALSIGLPVYNGERFLVATLDSLLAQTYTDFELIICDNCSSDRTEQICRSYASRDARIRYHRNSANIGAPRNFNLTFEMSQGRFFKWAAVGDLSASELVERCVAVLEQRPDVVLCYPKTRLIDEGGGPLSDYEDRLDLQFASPHERLAHLLWNLHMCNAPFGVFRSSTLKQTRLFGAYPDSDHVFLAEVALLGCIVELPDRLFSRRMFENSAVKYPSLYERLAFVDPGKKRRWHFPHWDLFLAHLSSIHRAPISWSERLYCYSKMHIWLRKWGNGLLQDLSLPFRQRGHLSRATAAER